MSTKLAPAVDAVDEVAPAAVDVVPVVPAVVLVPAALELVGLSIFAFVSVKRPSAPFARQPVTLISRALSLIAER
jgi:hypothetical protein